MVDVQVERTWYLRRTTGPNSPLERLAVPRPATRSEGGGALAAPGTGRVNGHQESARLGLPTERIGITHRGGGPPAAVRLRGWAAGFGRLQQPVTNPVVRLAWDLGTPIPGDALLEQPGGGPACRGVHPCATALMARPSGCGTARAIRRRGAEHTDSNPASRSEKAGCAAAVGRDPRTSSMATTRGSASGFLARGNPAAPALHMHHQGDRHNPADSTHRSGYAVIRRGAASRAERTCAVPLRRCLVRSAVGPGRAVQNPGPISPNDVTSAGTMTFRPHSASTRARVPGHGDDVIGPGHDVGGRPGQRDCQRD